MGQGLIGGLKLGKDGIYRFRIMVNGVVRTGSTACSGEKEAEKALTIIRADFLKEDKGTIVKKAPTFAKAIEIWKANKLGHVTDRYILTCSRALEIHFVPSIGTKLVDAITLEDIKACMQGYILKTQAGKAVKNLGGYNQVITYLHSLFQEMKDCKYMKHYKEILPEYVTKQKIPKRVIEEEDFDKVLAAVDKDGKISNSTAIRMGLYLGLRSIEVVRSKWCCINWNKGEFRNLDTKGNECDVIPICDEMMAALLKLKHQTELLSGKPVSPSAYLFPTKNGQHRQHYFFAWSLDKASKAVLGQHLSSHDLRRSFITTLHKNGIPVDTIRRLARHSSIITTMDYIQVNKAEKTDAINKVFNKKKEHNSNGIQDIQQARIS